MTTVAPWFIGFSGTEKKFASGRLSVSDTSAVFEKRSPSYLPGHETSSVETSAVLLISSSVLTYFRGD